MKLIRSTNRRRRQAVVLVVVPGTPGTGYIKQEKSHLYRHSQ
jgi:hypothetical protein